MFSTFATKKDIDRHVKTSLSKLPEHEKYQRGLAIARQYLKLNEFASAEHWLSCFLSVQEDSAQAHKLLGHCYERQKKIDRAITSYQRSLQLDSKQTGLITDVCKLLLSDDNFSKNLSKAKHWCDLAESERINHEAVLNLKLKVANKDAATDNKLVKEIILKEILARPMDPGLRIRLVKHFIDEKKLDDAFKYCYDIEMKFTETFQQSVEWANAISSMLTRYVEANASSYQSNWNYWLLTVMTLDRQIYLNLLADSSLQTIKQSNIREIATLLFELDQTLRKFADKGRNSCSHKQLAEEFLLHYRGQLLLHSASLLFKNEKQATNSKARDVTTKCLPLLFLAYQCGVPDSDEPWLRHTNDITRQLVAYWNKQAAFRCCQAGSSVLSCVDDSVDASVIAQIQSVTESKIWNTAEDLVNQVRQFCADINWKKSIFRALYSNNGDQISKMSSSYFMQSASIGEPQYELPKREHIQMYLEIAQYLCPSSLAYQIYLGLGVDDLAELRCKSFNGLNFSTNNLDNCNVETLNQLDVDSFLYCAVLVAKSCLEGERKYQDKMNSGKPRILPAPNMLPTLCEENKSDWWNAACAVFKNTKSANFSSNKQLLQHGLQAVRGTGTPITDVIVLLKLGKILAKRINNTTLPEERRQLELRTESVYKAGVLLWKMRNESSFNSTNIFFKYGIDSFECSQEAVKLAEDALTYLAGVYFKHGRYEEFTQDFGGIPLPFAAYFRAEAFKKLDESSKTPLKTKKFYSERARDCIKQTQKYLELPYVEKSHPLHYVVHSEIKRLQFNDSMDGGGGNNLNSSLNGFGNSGADDSDHFQSFSSSNNADRLNRSEREIAVNYAARSSELESLIRNMMEVLTIVKDDVLNIRNDVGDIQERLVKIEDHIHKKPAEDDAATAAALNDLYILDELQNPSFVNQPNYNQTLQQQLTPNLPGRLPPNHPAAAVAMQHPNPYQQFYNTSYPMYMQQQYAAQQQQQQQRAQMGAVASPLHTYQDSSLLVPASPYYQQQQQQQQPPQQPPPVIPPAMLPVQQQPAAPKPTSNIFEQALQTPTLLNTWNSTYNATNALQTSTPAAPLDKVPPVNVVITNSDPLPINISVGTSQPTYSVTIPPQHIKHSVVSNTTPAVTAVTPIASGIENISPVGQQQQPVNTKFPIAAPKVTMPAITPGMFSQSIAASAAFNESGAGSAAAEEEDDDDDAANVSGEYDPRPDFKPIIALPDEVEVKTGEEDEEQIFCGRSKLLRMVDREWKERGLGDLKILKSKTDPGKYRIVMRREQVHKIAANHTITPELIIKPMEKNNKCYTWAAMDFADEEPKKETFCARFSTPELAKEFFDKFNQAKDEVARLRNQQSDSTPAPTKTETPKSTGFSFSTPKSSDSSAAPVASKPTFGSLASKPIFGSSAVTTTPPTSNAAATSTTTTSTPFQGFSFANNYAPPKLQTPVAPEKPVEPAASKPSPFASFTFGASAINSTTAPADSTSNKSFTDIFSSLNKLATPPSSVPAVASTTTPAALNTSGGAGGGGEDAVEEFVPTADFKPVIPLPDLVEVKTGEEGFDCVYEHRAKMFRMDKTAKEWKERGLGNIRVLVKKDDSNVARLLMRREQVLKLCCNQLISKDLKFTVSEKNANTLTWVGHDYSENELLVETFAIRFKTADIAKDFHNLIKKVQAAMTVDGKTDKPKEDKKSEPAKGFGDKFKPKAGAWNCEACYVSNKPDDLYCMACGGPKDSSVPKKESSLLDTLPKSTSKFSFGVQPVATEAPKFSFGVPAATAAAPTTTTTVDSTKKAEPKGFGDQFKPKAGSWSCSGCYISNKGDDLYCMACETPKDNTVPKKESKSNILGGGDAPKFNFTTGGGFSFGVPAATNATPTAPAAKTGGFGSIGSTPGSGFSFTPTKTPAPSAATTAATTAAVTSKASFQFELPKPTMSFGSTLSTPAATVVAEDKAAKPVVPEKSTFEFVFKPKSPGGGGKSKSPGRTISVGSEKEDGEGAEEGGDDEGAAAEEENNTYFTPVIPLPEKVEVKTGEEEEDVLYSHRAKLFRFVDKEWKERGIGDVKILKHKTNDKLRVVMRRDQVLKICLNHALDADVQYQKKDEKSWQFVVNDFSEGTFEVMNFSLRFKTAEIAAEFRDAIDRALAGEESIKTPGGGGAGKLNSTLESTISTPNSNFNYSQLSDISLDDKELTTKLKLPEGFFDSPKQPCKGCRGCDPDSFVFPSYGAAVNEELVDEKPLPVSVAQVKKVPIAPKLSKSPKKVSFSENTEEQKVTSLFGSVAMPSATTTTEAKASPFSINSFVAAEKQSSTGNIFGSVSKPAEQGTPKSIFGGGFLSSTGTGSPATGSIFSSSLNTTPNPVIKPAQDAFKSPLLQPAAAFGTTTSSPGLNKSAEGVQLFGSSFGTSTPPSQSIFGGSPAATTTSLSNATTPVFGSSGNMTSKLSFGSVTAAGSDQKVFGSGMSFAEAAKGFDKKVEDKTEPPKADILEKADSGMSFASLASGTDGFLWNKKSEANSGFVGLTVKEDIFTRMANKSKNDSGAGDGDEHDEAAGGGDENYDPHYEPIIKLPDEIEVRTGEEDEVKLFGERAKLYRYDSDAKEWKERGVGELKILHHPGRSSYRLLLRREQIFKLVLNHAISSDLQITPMNNSGKAFVWGAMNHAEEGPQLEKLAARFKNEDLAASFKAVLEQCQEKLRQKPDLEPDQD
uniref:Putative nuclear pore complex component n=1 Tax=Culex tarsalis TaxID=7177 RepID=A0A1Q3F444_CULTA